MKPHNFLIKKVETINYFKVNYLAVLACLLTACAPLQNLTIADLKKQENFYKSWNISKTIPEVVSDIYKFEEKCRPLPYKLDSSPSEPNKARIVGVMPGFTQMNPVMLIDFEQDVSITYVKSYAYYPGGRKDIELMMKVIQKPGQCN